jgi:DNA-binding IclR family transcriptional regulator
VLDATGRVAYSIMILGQGYDLRPEEIRTLANHLVEAAREATARLGGTSQ